MVIEKISPLRGKGYRVSFGEESIDITGRTLKDFGLGAGDDLTEETLEEILRADALSRAWDKALSLIAFQARTRREVADRLRKLSYGEETVRQVLDKLVREGLLDDEAYALEYIAGAIERSGRMKILHHLRNKGISQEIIDGLTIEEKPGTARKELDKKFGDRMDFSRQEDWVRGARFLAQRGFAYETIKKALGRGEDDFFEER
jgi:regulatory protein